MTPRPDRSDEAAHLRARVNEVGAQFLLTEVQSGLTLIDIADTSESAEAKQRRRRLALDAYEVVADRLARTGTAAVVLSAEERDEITKLQSELGRRLGR